jgi:hypothetical protein
MATFVGEGAKVTALNGGGSATIPLPAGVQSGDMLILLCSFNSGCALASTPSGWTISAAAGGETPPKAFSGVTYAYHKIAGGAESDLSITMNNNGGGQSSNFRIVALRGILSLNTSVYRGTDQNPSAAGNIVFPQVTTTSNDCVLFGFTSETQNHTATLTPGSGYSSTGSHQSPSPASIAVYALSSGAAGNYTPAPVTVTEAGNTFRSLTLAFSQSVPGPTITVQPSNQSAVSPAPAQFSVTATASGGGSLSYQWQRNPGGNTSFANVSTGSGGNSATYTTAATSITGGNANNGDSYRCVVTETGGSSPGVTNSNAATLTVSAAAANLTFSLTNNTNSALLNTSISNVTVQQLSNRNQILSLSSQTTNGVGNMVISNVALVSGTEYIVNGWNLDGTLAFITKVTAS